jgi:hypothetical protein
VLYPRHSRRYQDPNLAPAEARGEIFFRRLQKWYAGPPISAVLAPIASAAKCRRGARHDDEPSRLDQARFEHAIERTVGRTAKRQWNSAEDDHAHVHFWAEWPKRVEGGSFEGGWAWRLPKGTAPGEEVEL